MASVKGYPEFYTYRNNIKKHLILRQYSDGSLRTVANVSSTIPESIVRELVDKLNDELAK